MFNYLIKFFICENVRCYTKTPSVSRVAVKCKDNWRYLCLHGGVRTKEDEGNVLMLIAFWATPEMQWFGLVWKPQLLRCR